MILDDVLLALLSPTPVDLSTVEVFTSIIILLLSNSVYLYLGHLPDVIGLVECRTYLIL